MSVRVFFKSKIAGEGGNRWESMWFSHLLMATNIQEQLLAGFSHSIPYDNRNSTKVDFDCYLANVGYEHQK